MALAATERLHYVYALYDGKKLLYIGRTVNLKNRWRVFERKHGTSVKQVVVCAGALEYAQEIELRAIAKFSPPFNVYLASSRCRLGLRNSDRHNAAISGALKGRVLSDQHKAKLWEHRSRAPEDNAFYGKRHSDKTKERIRNSTAAQFRDPEKRERHRQACLKAWATKKAAQKNDQG